MAWQWYMLLLWAVCSLYIVFKDRCKDWLVDRRLVRKTNRKRWIRWQNEITQKETGDKIARAEVAAAMGRGRQTRRGNSRSLNANIQNMPRNIAAEIQEEYEAERRERNDDMVDALSIVQQEAVDNMSRALDNEINQDMLNAEMTIETDGHGLSVGDVVIMGDEQRVVTGVSDDGNTYTVRRARVQDILVGEETNRGTVVCIVGHGFSAGDALYLDPDNAGSFILATADQTRHVSGLVAEVIDDDNVRIVTTGRVTGRHRDVIVVDDPYTDTPEFADHLLRLRPVG